MFEFTKAMTDAGVTPPNSIIDDGEIHRFRVGNEKQKNGWYVFTANPPHGAFGDWKSQIKQTWQPEKEYTEEEKEVYKASMTAAREARTRDRDTKSAKCRESASDIWTKAVREIQNDYVDRKCIKPVGVRYSLDMVVIPIRDISGVLHGLQFIRQDGTKKFLPGTAKKSNYFSIGKLGDCLCICEGYATAASIHECTNLPVAIAFDAGNLQPVASTLRSKYPDVKIVICADNDSVGIDAATKAAISCDGLMVYPPTDGYDFNDMHKANGLDSVRRFFADSI